jgi:anaerobic selenocysteine-containing dehydrogenase
MSLTRRRFLQWAGATGLGAVVFNGCNVPDEEIQVQSPLLMPEDLVTGRDNYYATVFQSGAGSEGLNIRVMEGRAKKVEGNPDYPLNTGKHGVRSEALLQALYHPDRIKGPLARVSPQGPFRPIGWDEGIGRLAELLRDADPASVVLAVGPVRGVLANVVKEFAKDRAQLLGFDPLDQTVLRETMGRVFAQEALPDFDIANTRFLLNFGSDFLGTWLAPTHFMRGYGEFRQGDNHRRGRFVQVESRFSTTTASADEWVYVNPGTEGLMALSLAYVIVYENLGDKSAADALTNGGGATALQQFQPRLVAGATGVPAERITALARAFADTSRGPSLAMGGGSAAAHTNGLFNLTAIYSLNYLVGSVNKPGGIIFNPTTLLSQVPGAPLKEWTDALEAMRRGDIKVLMVRDANLLHGLPGQMDAAGAVRNVETVVSFSSFLDETTATADLVLPGHTPLEEWGSDTPDPGPGYTTVALQQPVVVPFVNTRSFGDVLLRTARELGMNGGLLSHENMREALRGTMRPLQQTGVGSVNRPTFEEFWNRALQRGGWWNSGDKAASAAPKTPALPTSAEAPHFKGSAKSYPFFLAPFESHSMGDGSMAHLPWLQATPDPVSTVTWVTWVELNPETARRLGVRQEDLVSVESPTGALIEAPVLINPASPPDVVGVPFGQGHTQFTTYAAGRGANIFGILDPAQERETGALAWAATRVRVVKTVRKQRISKMQGTVPVFQVPSERIVQVKREG